MTELILPTKTAEQLRQAIKHPPHAVLVTGGQGSGKQALSLCLAAEVLGVKDVAIYPYFLQILPENQSTGIDDIRSAQAFLSKRTVGKAQIRRIILINNAQAMTTEAQNALLKILEEPPEDTMFILTTDKVQGVKATIRSRSQQLHITPWSLQAAVKAFQERGYTEAAITTAYHVSGGQPGLLSTLLESPDEHEILQAITLAKSFLKMTAYERLQQVDALSKAKDQTNLLLDGLSRLANNGLRQAASKGSVTQAQQFHKVSTHVQGLQIALSKTANPKLALTHLFLNI